MTQFLLTAAYDFKLPEGYSAEPVSAGDGCEASAFIFGASVRTVRILPVGSEMDSVVDLARDQVLAGKSLAATELGMLLAEVARHGKFALFWASDYKDLPRASTLEELWQTIQPQLLAEVGNWELYLLFAAA